MPLVPTIVQIRPIAQYLVQIDIAKRGLFGGGINNQWARKIYLIGKSVQRVYDSDPTNNTLYKTADFLYSLLGIWGLRAQTILNNGGGSGSVSPVSPTSAKPLPLDFEVSGGSIISSGQSTINILSFIGYNVDFVRNGISQNTTNIGGSYFSWNRNTGLFTIYPAANAGELFRITPIG